MRQDQVARLGAVHARFAEAAHAQLLTLADACGNLDRHMLAIGDAALALAFLARVLDDLARAAAVAAGAGRLHVAEEGVLHRDHAAAALAFGAVDLMAALAHAAAAARLARSQAVVDDFLLGARSDLFERQAQADSHIAAFLAHVGAAARSAAEEAREQIAHTEAAAEQVVEIDVLIAARAACAAGSARNGTEAVVLGALRGIGKHVVSLVELFEAVLGIGGLVHVGMKLARLAAERLLDFVVGGGFRYAENGVEVFCHNGWLPSSYLQVAQRASCGAHGVDDFRIIHARGADDRHDARRIGWAVLRSYHRHA